MALTAGGFFYITREFVITVNRIAKNFYVRNKSLICDFTDLWGAVDLRVIRLPNARPERRPFKIAQTSGSDGSHLCVDAKLQ